MNNLTQDSGLRTQDSVLSLSQLTAGIARVFDESFPSPLWIRAEIAKLNLYPSSGHCYPSLVEKDKGTIKAEMRGTIWATDYSRINGNFIKITREPLKEGIQILFRAYVKYHPVYGLSLQIIDVDPSYTLGEMAREKTETIEKLKKEGLFDLNRKLELPLLPKRIAIISVKTSKGFSDFINILENNAWGYSFSCVLFPALLQGDKAVESIAAQMKTIRGVASHFDVVAIIRGGGGDVGLNCYDNYLLSKEIAQCPLPVITGIGHSTNETVVEMVAGFNKITPTDVPYFLIQMFHNFSGRIQESQEKIISFTKELLEEEKRRWGEECRRFLLQTGNLMKSEQNRLQLAGSRLRFKPGLLTKEHQIRLINTSEWLKMRVARYFESKFNQLKTFDEKVNLLDPRQVLKRGYSITYHKGKAITDVSDLQAGDEIQTRLCQGNIYSEVKSKSE